MLADVALAEWLSKVHSALSCVHSAEAIRQGICGSVNDACKESVTPFRAEISQICPHQACTYGLWSPSLSTVLYHIAMCSMRTYCI